MARRGPAGFALDQPARAKRQVRGDGGALAALIDVSLTWLLQIGFGLLSADPARAVAFAISQGTATVVNFAVQCWIIFRKAGVRVVAKQDPS